MDKKLTGIFAYIGVIFWLIAYLAGDKEGAKFHLNQGLVLIIIGIANGVVGLIPILGSIVSWVISVALLVLAIMGIVAAAKDEEKPLPVIGGIRILK